MIKILHVLDSLGVGGMERVVIDIANGLDAARFAQVICCVSRRGAAAHRLRTGVRCIDLNKGNERDLLMPLKIARVIRAEQPDVIHTRSWAGVDGVIAHALTRRARLVHSEHGRNVPYIHHEPTKRKLARRCVYQLADAVFTVSQEMREYFCRETGFAPERMRVIPNGVDIGKFDRANADGVRAEFGLALDDCVIGTVARLDATKDLATLVRAFAHLCRTRGADKLKLLLVGDGDERGALEQLAAELGIASRVVFAGLRHDVPRLLRAMQIFALSSLSEGLPGAVLEAMSASLPIVATNVGTLPELVMEGENGFLVAPRAAEAMAERFGMLVRDAEQARRFGATGRKLVARDYSLEVMLRRYEMLYSSWTK